jgi:acetyl esterase/lipase
MSESILDLAPPPYDRRVRYGDAPQQFFDLRFPTGEQRARTVINIHGGYWRAKYDLQHAGHFCGALTNAGCVSVNLEYRRVGNPSGGWPGTFDDVRHAFDYIHRHATELRIDKQQITLTGHSAGSQLALWLAAHEPRLRRVVALAGVLDLRRAYELHLSNDAVLQFLGGTPEQVPETYSRASPIELPIGHAEQFVIHGTRDEDVPMELSTQYVKAKSSRGEKVHYVELAGADHFDIIDPRSRYWDTIANIIISDHNSASRS